MSSCYDTTSSLPIKRGHYQDGLQASAISLYLTELNPGWNAHWHGHWCASTSPKGENGGSTPEDGCEKIVQIWFNHQGTRVCPWEGLHQIHSLCQTIWRGWHPLLGKDAIPSWVSCNERRCPWTYPCIYVPDKAISMPIWGGGLQPSKLRIPIHAGWPENPCRGPNAPHHYGKVNKWVHSQRAN